MVHKLSKYNCTGIVVSIVGWIIKTVAFVSVNSFCWNDEWLQSLTWTANCEVPLNQQWIAIVGWIWWINVTQRCFGYEANPRLETHKSPSLIQLNWDINLCGHITARKETKINPGNHNLSQIVVNQNMWSNKCNVLYLGGKDIETGQQICLTFTLCLISNKATYIEVYWRYFIQNISGIKNNAEYDEIGNVECHVITIKGRGAHASINFWQDRHMHI